MLTIGQSSWHMDMPAFSCNGFFNIILESRFANYFFPRYINCPIVKYEVNSNF